MGRGSRLKKVTVQEPLKLDFGSGPNKRPGFQGVDSRKFDGVDHVVNLTARWMEEEAGEAQIFGAHIGDFKPWPWAAASVAEAHSSHFIEHLTATERVHFCNELYRVLVPNGTCQIITPHWASNRAYGDFTHQWPPVAEMWFYYLNKEWRAQNAPHTDHQWNPDGFSCHFDATWGYALRPDLSVRNQEFQQFAIQNYKEVCTDLIATLTKREMP